MHIPRVMSGARAASARAHAQMLPSIPYLGKGWTDCAEIWCVVRGQLAMRFTLSGMGFICTCARARAPLFRISGTAGRIALIFGMLLQIN